MSLYVCVCVTHGHAWRDLIHAAEAIRLTKELLVERKSCWSQCSPLWASIATLRALAGFACYCKPEQTRESLPAMPAPVNCRRHWRLHAWFWIANPHGVRNMQTCEQRLQQYLIFDRHVSVPERLRRRGRNRLGSARRGSNPLGVVVCIGSSCCPNAAEWHPSMAPRQLWKTDFEQLVVQIRGSIMVRICACHAKEPGWVPSCGVYIDNCYALLAWQLRAQREREIETHTHTSAHTHTPTKQSNKQTRKPTSKQLVTIIEPSPCVPPGKLSWFDINSATNARTHVQRIQARFHNQQDYNSAATDRKEATSTDAPETCLFDLTGPPRIYNEDLEKHVSRRAREEQHNLIKRHMRQTSNRGLPVSHPRL